MKKKNFLFLPLLLSSCSVVMASNKSGVGVDALQSLCSRAELLALEPEVLESSSNEDGVRVETYRIQKEKGSVARALMHGLLDISTFLLWELAGTPIESALSEQKYYTVKVTYDKNESIQNIELKI